ncbi:hypothetical protein ACV7JQ_03140 [Globicatella sulfidifaciens]
MNKIMSNTIKLLFIIFVWGFLFWNNRQAIHDIVSQTNRSAVDKGMQITRQILGANQHDISNQSTGRKIGTENATSKSPRTLDEAVLTSVNYLHAQEVAQQFNQQLDIDSLNEQFTILINQTRAANNWALLSVGYHLAAGVDQRINQLADYHYLGSQTIDNQDFRSLFEIEDASSRLGENLYELYIAADDIHLSTWLKPEIFAEYLHRAFETSAHAELYQNFNSQYIKIVASPTDFRVDDIAYVRLVVALVMDTQVE